MDLNMANTNILIKPCPVCMTPMTVRKTSAIVEGGYRKWFYFLYCGKCGYGPHTAFDSLFQAVNHWNCADDLTQKVILKETRELNNRV